MNDTSQLRWLTGAVLLFPLAIAQPAVSQIIPNGLGTTWNGTNVQGGTQMGGNLFHSFSQFSLLNGSATFNAPAGVQTIFARVTNAASYINGTLGTTNNANLIFINPYGITFGPNATLSVGGGSFLATTADSVLFPDGTEFSATSPTPTLSMSVPSGLQFNNNSATITNQVTGVLRVGSTATLALIGGNVSIPRGGMLARTGGSTANPGGQIAIGAVNNGQVSLSGAGQRWNFGYGGVTSFGNVSMSQGASVSVNGTGSGNIQVVGGNVDIAGGTLIQANTTGSLTGGNLSITANNFSMSGGSQVQSNVNATATAAARGGSINIQANSVQLTGVSSNGLNSTGLQARTFSAGTAGNITVNTGQLSLLNGAAISVSTGTNGSSGAGNGGSLLVNASNTLVSGVSASGLQSGLFSQQASTTGTGSAGSMTINSGGLVVQNGGVISVSNTSPNATAGNLNINAPFFQVQNGGQVLANTAGGQGNMFIQSRNMQLIGNGSIATNATGSFNGGNISINTATLVLLTGSSITANAQKGFGGNVNITATGIFVSRDSRITATSELGAQFDGTVELKTPDVDPSKGLVSLPADVTDLSKMVEQGCSNRQSAGSFVVSGRGGLPPNPGDVLSELPVLSDLGVNSSNTQTDRRSPSTSTNSELPPVAIAPTSPDSLVEAQGWVTNATGEVVLLADARNGVAQSPGFATATCHASK